MLEYITTSEHKTRLLFFSLEFVLQSRLVDSLPSLNCSHAREASLFQCLLFVLCQEYFLWSQIPHASLSAFEHLNPELNLSSTLRGSHMPSLCASQLVPFHPSFLTPKSALSPGLRKNFFVLLLGPHQAQSFPLVLGSGITPCAAIGKHWSISQAPLPIFKVPYTFCGELFLYPIHFRS